MERHYGMDWLRIGAFGLLILYHIGMFFVHWGWHVKTADPLAWVAIPMLAVNPWRLPLLFVVSGFASRALLMRNPGAVRFLRQRTVRLMLPVLFAVILLIPPQPWVELQFKHGYTADYPTFWMRDYFRFGAIEGIVVPTWQHLWFVVYLWAYTMAVGLLLPVVPGTLLQRGFDRAFGGLRVLIVPVLWFAIARGLIARDAEPTHALVDDWTAHIVFLPAFLFGLGLAGSAPAWAGIRRWWRAAAAVAVLAYLPVIAVEIAFPGDTPLPAAWRLPYFAARAIQGAAAVIALIGLADRFWNVDRPWRAPLTEAVFPFYIIHQTIIVVVGWYLLRFALPPLAEFAILVVTTVAGCWAFYRIGRTVGWLRPLIGLAPRRRSATG